MSHISNRSRKENMSATQPVVSNIDDTTKIRDQIFAGKAALDNNQTSFLLNSINRELNSVVKEDSFSQNHALIKTWQEILEFSFSGQLAHDIAEQLDVEIFYKFGDYLNKSFDNLNQSSLINLAHAYLDIFRLSPFLIKIYGEKKWEILVLDLVKKSNFTVSELFKQRVRDYKNKGLFKVIRGSAETDYSWRQVSILVESYSLAFTNSQMLYPGKVAFLLENSLQMALLDLACLTTGIVNIMIPANSVPQHVSFILNQTKASTLFVYDEKQLQKVKSIKKEIPHVKHVILLQGNSIEEWITPHKDFVTAGVDVSPQDVEKLKQEVRTDSLASIMYTSGTTGEPKGIMFSQLNIVYKRFCRAMALPKIGDHDRFLSFLPLYHTFGRWLEMMGSVFWGTTYAFMENPSVDTMIANMNLAKPSIFISIPKKWIQLYESITKRVDIEVEDEKVILKTLQDISGGNLKWGLSAAGFLPPEVFQFFQKYGVELMSGFGMTEATGGITMTPPGLYRPNSLGRSLPGIEIKLGDDGELLVRGAYVLMGYFDQNDEDTFIDGWFPTGDVMKMDENGFIEIIDRKKEIYKNIKGETIAPQKIENYFRDFEYVKQVFLVGDHRAFNTVLIYPNFDIEDSVLDHMSETQQHEYFSSVIVTVNKFLAPFERIVDFRIIKREFSGEKGELTPKGTYKRRVIEENFDDVIEEMYTKNYTSVTISHIEIRIPNWFLREKGCLSGDIMALPRALSIPKLQNKLKIEKSKKGENIYHIGDYCYEVNCKYIDLQILLTNPMYWLGNDDFYKFSGEGIFLWYRQDTTDPKIKFCSNNLGRIIDNHIKDEMIAIISAEEQSLYGLHHAVLLLQSNLAMDGNFGVEYIRMLLEDESLLIYKLALKLLRRSDLSDVLIIRRELFKIAVQKFKDQDLQDLLELYLDSNYDLLDDQAIHTMVGISRGAGVIESVENVLYNQVIRISEDKNQKLDQTSIPSLFNVLCNYGIHHPTSANKIRQIIVPYQLRKDWPELKYLADQARNNLRQGFRNWLGSNHTVAVDVETGEEYGWKDVVITEQDMDSKDKERIVSAISETSALREAIFLFSGGTLIRLNDILPGGVWVSQIGSYQDKSVYRVTVQTRFQGSFEIVINLVNNVPTEEIEEEVNWLILAGSRHYVQELVETFGGYWGDSNLWTAKFVPGDSVAKFLHREVRKKDETTRNRLYYLWPFFVWNSAASYYNFWKLTRYSLQLANPSPDNYIVPTHDYLTRTRVVSFSERVAYKNLTDFFDNFFQHFIKSTEEAYPFLTRKSIWNYVFSGVINAEGEEMGTEVLQKYKKELETSVQNEHIKSILHSLDRFLNNVRENGFIPKQLFFAYKRFHRWYKLNRDASLSAQGQTLYDIYETYHLPELEKSYPEIRTRFFLETAFTDSSEEVKSALKGIQKIQHEKHITKEDTLAIISNIQEEFDLSEKESFFLTRLSYSHLKPTDSAELLKSKAEGAEIANLVVQVEDYDGNYYSIRKPVSPKEISRLHQLYIDANLLVHFHADHQFLVAISERGFIIGGLFYLRSSDDTIHMEKIVVSDRYRRKGISEGLMNEFFNRMKSENVKFVTTGFFRPEYFYRFGFKIERKYSGLVKELETS